MRRDQVKQATHSTGLFGVAHIPQMLSADGGLTGGENLLVSARLYNVRDQERARCSQWEEGTPWPSS